jgi:3-hydroxybutyryl-CoA dehydratase
MNFLSRHFDHIELGDSFRSRGRTITESDIVQWCALTGDWYRLHSDAHYAAGTRFGQRIAPGLLVLAYAAGLGIPPDAPAIVANYGTDALRFTAPTFIGDTLHLRSEVLGKTVKREGRDGVVRLRWDMHNQNGTVVMASELHILMAFTAEEAA